MKKTLLMIFIVVIGFTSCDTEAISNKTEISSNNNEVMPLVQEDMVVENGDGEKMFKAIDENDLIHAKGKNLYNQEGELINLRGVNIGGYLFQEFWMTPTKPSANISAERDIYEYFSETYSHEEMYELLNAYQDNYFTLDDFDNVANLGINTVRLPFWYLNIVDLEGNIRPNWYERFDWFIEEAGKRGIYVILDFHGAPGSQNGSDHSGVDGGDNKETASKFFFGDTEEVTKNQALFYEIWEMVAIRYQSNPVVAGYDLLNEPYCTYRYDSTTPVPELHQRLWNVYDEAYRRIRMIDSEHLIIMEATWDPIDLPDPKVYGWDNVMYEYHNYLYDDYDNKSNKQILNMQKKINLIKSANYDVPSFMGEFNYFNSFDAWDRGLKLLNDSGIHWTIWTYKTVQNYGNWGLYHHTSGGANLEVLDFEKTKLIWSKVGDSRPNSRLIEVVKKYLNSEIIEFK